MQKTKLELYPWKGEYNFGFVQNSDNLKFLDKQEIFKKAVNYLGNELEERKNILGDVSETGYLGEFGSLISEFPDLFSERLGMVRGRYCDVELIDEKPVPSS